MLTLTNSKKANIAGVGFCMCKVPRGAGLHPEKTQPFTVPGPRDGFLEEVAHKLFHDHWVRISEGERMEVLTVHVREPFLAEIQGLALERFVDRDQKASKPRRCF